MSVDILTRELGLLLEYDKYGKLKPLIQVSTAHRGGYIGHGKSYFVPIRADRIRKVRAHCLLPNWVTKNGVRDLSHCGAVYSTWARKSTIMYENALVLMYSRKIAFFLIGFHNKEGLPMRIRGAKEPIEGSKILPTMRDSRLGPKHEKLQLSLGYDGNIERLSLILSLLGYKTIYVSATSSRCKRYKDYYLSLLLK